MFYSRLQGTETRKTWHIVPAGNLGALSICRVVFLLGWLFFSFFFLVFLFCFVFVFLVGFFWGGLKTHSMLCKCVVLCKSICMARASPGWAGPTGEEPKQEVTAATPQQPPRAQADREICCAQSSLVHAKLISSLLPHAAPRNKHSLSLKTVLMLPSFSFQ